MKFNIDLYAKPKKMMVIELDDEVEYLIDEMAEKMIREGKKSVPLKRLVDLVAFSMSTDDLAEHLNKHGVVDYVDVES
jgi:hypothetical protein